MMHRLRRRVAAKRPQQCRSTIAFEPSQSLTANPGADSSFILQKLPPEIIVDIFHQIDSITDAISFATSCKSLLRIATMCELKVPHRVAHMARWARHEDQEHIQRCTCINMEFLLQRIRPRDARGYPSRAWSVCVDCMTCLPTRRSYWKAVHDGTDLSEWEKKDGRRWEDVVTHFSAGVRLQCPSCVVREWTVTEEIRNRPRIDPPPPPLPENHDDGDDDGSE
ncbi:hypothetical protein B0T10DRAFT_42291 [Thelonectria olida]|uniref:F-box domain-containing protein n=1 Tax=Thelonectria olida TaxID=1576542 RepID=A0A9P8W4C9_9HYPO|nr:hypothetical protein B0T10DRAFT_42291 [Thelonectria olida]